MVSNDLRLTMTEPLIRPATAADLERFYGAPPARTMRAWVAVLDGEPLAVAGIAYQSIGQPPYLFSDLKPEMRRHRKAIVRGARQMLAAVARPGLMAIAGEAGSPRLLTRLGFVHVGTTPQGEIYQWQKQQSRSA
jgi:hypothetical protein